MWKFIRHHEFYIGIFIQKGLLQWNAFLARFDDLVIDRVMVDGWKDVTMVVKSVVGKFDDIVVDRILVDGTGNLASAGGWIFRRFQTGKVQQYLLFVFIDFDYDFQLCIILIKRIVF